MPTQYLVFWVVLFALLAVMLLAHGSVSPRWEELIRIVQRWFLSGTPLLVSIAVITIAILCLLDVQYVSRSSTRLPWASSRRWYWAPT